MSLKAIPLLVLSLILYNAIVWWGGNAPNDLLYGAPVIDTASNTAVVQGGELFQITMPNGGVWKFHIGDLILVISIVLLGLEVIKATYTRGAGLADQALSMIVFVAFLLEFLLVPMAATSLFFFLVLLSGFDVVVGSIVGIRTARRDFGVADGAAHHH
jgi:hypothetical protein